MMKSYAASRFELILVLVGVAVLTGMGVVAAVVAR